MTLRFLDEPAAPKRKLRFLDAPQQAPAQQAIQQPNIDIGGEDEELELPSLQGGIRRAPEQTGFQGAANIFSNISDLATGKEKRTPQIDKLSEIGRAPEISEFSLPAFKASVGLSLTGKTKELKSILSEQFGGKISFSEDSKGNTIVKLPSGEYALNKPGLSPQDVLRGFFDMIAFTPAGRAGSVTGAALKSAATEAALEATEAKVGGEFDTGDVLAAGGIGGGFKGVERLVGAGARLKQGVPQSSVVGAGEEAGIDILTSDIKPPKTFAGKTVQQTGEKIPAAGTGALRQAQQEQREIAVNKVVDDYGEFSYTAIIDSLKSQKNKVKKAAGNVLETTGNKLDTVGEIALTSTRKSIIEASIQLRKKGVIKSEGAITDLEKLIDTLGEAPQTFTTLKENRTAFREIINGMDKSERSQLTSRAKSLLSKVQSSMTKDMDEFAKDNLSPTEFFKWKKANTVYAGEAAKLTKTKLKNVLDKGDVTPEAVQSLLFSQKPSEVRLLFNSLTTEGRQNARSAIISKVATILGKRAPGITPNSFLTEMRKQGMPIELFFKGEEKRKLNGLLKALNATRRAQDAAVSTPTGQQTLGILTGGAIVSAPVTTLLAGGSIGGLSRLYESAAVRNALLRLDSVPRQSTQFEQALRELNAALTTGAQTLRENTQER